MNWKKRKKLRKIAHSHGLKHYYQWAHNIRILCQLNRFWTYVIEGGISIHDLIDELNKLYIMEGYPERCITYDQLINKINAENDERILRFLLREDV